MSCFAVSPDTWRRRRADRGPAAVLGGVAYVISTRVAPGVIVHHGLNKIIFGEYKGGTSRRTEQLRDMLRRTAVTGELHPDIRVPLWEKHLARRDRRRHGDDAAGHGAHTRLPRDECPFRGVIEEAAAVGRALGIPRPVDQRWALVSSLDPSARGSMSHDVMAGRRLELEALNGAVVRLGRQVRIPTPLNFAVYAALKPYAEGAPPE